MSQLTLHIDEDQRNLQPGQTVSGTVQWNCQQPPKQAAVRLLWYTEGKGTEDVAVAEEHLFENPQTCQEQSFSFCAPVGPYSFSGFLISLIWAVELQVDKDCVRETVTLSSNGREIRLYRVGS